MANDSISDEARLQLDRILASTGFVNSERLRRFLSYSVERSLQADWDHLKETVIGVEVFGRPAGYDPKTDAIVRVEAYRLRQRLSEYYLHQGRLDPIRIQLPKGSYAVQFTEAPVPPAPPVEPTAQPLPAEANVGHPAGPVALAKPDSRHGNWLLGAAGGALAMGLVLTIFRLTPGAGPPLPPTVKLTSDGGWSGDASITPDGQHVVYSSDRGVDENLSLWRMPLNGGEPVRITHEPYDAVEAGVSPDGQLIVYRSRRGDASGLYITSAVGGTSRLLVQGGSRPRFSPDGKWILYTVRNEQEWSPGRIYVILADGGAPRELAPNFADAHYAIWSHDGKAILFCGTRISGMPEAEHDWWVLPFPSGQPIKTGVYTHIARHLDLPGKAPFNQHLEMPSDWVDNQVYFASPSGPQPVALWRLRLDRNSFQWTGQPSPERLTAGGLETSPRVQGGKMVFSTGTYNSDIWVQDLDAKTGEPRSRARRLVSHPLADAFPALSQDGQQLAFTSERSGRRQLYLRSLEAGQERIISPAEFSQDFPVFSRRGDQVAFREMREPRVPILLASTKTPGSVQEICPDCGSPTDWSPDDRYLLFEPGAAIAYVGRLDVANGKPQPFLTHPERSLRHARYSPKGDWIAFHEETGKDARRIWLARGDRITTLKDWVPITDGNYEDVNPVWSPDGQLIYYLSNRDGHRCVYAQRVDAATGKPVGERITVQHFHGSRRSLLRATRSRVAAVGLTILPNRMIFTLDEQTSEVQMANLP